MIPFESQRRLASDAEGFDDCFVSCKLLGAHIIEKTSPSADKLQEPPPGMKILFMGFEMFCQLGDPFRYEGNLHLC